MEISDYLKIKHQSIVRIKSNPTYTKRRLNPDIIESMDSTVVVLINFIIKDKEIYPDYHHPVICSVRQAAVFLKTKGKINKKMSLQMMKSIDNARKDIKTIAKKNAFWINEGKPPFNGLSDFNKNAWLVLYKEDYDRLSI